MAFKRRNYPINDSRNLQEKLAQELAHADKKENSSSNPKSNVLKYTNGDKWYKYFKKAYLVRRSHYEENHIDVAISSLYMGLCLQNLGDADGAIIQFNSWVGIMLEDKNLAEFYRKLMISEAGHYTMFLKFARKYGDLKEVNQKWDELLQYEAQIMKGLGTKETIHG
jgi:tetratricopeptide (TPR) repeat protein